MSVNVALLPAAPLPSWMETMRRAYQSNYYAMYSSLYGGIVTDPLLMSIPVDDHLVHRGDGIFETFKCVNGHLYNLRAHLERLAQSAEALAFVMPLTSDALETVIIETVRHGRHPDAAVRILISRGPGSFDVNPYDSAQALVFVMVTSLKRPFMELHPEGARVRTSAIPPKPPFFAAIKCCNYIPNVLMKKEAVDAGVDFVMAFSEREGWLTEGATENMGLVNQDGRLRFPRHGILAGTTMRRVMDLARQLVPTVLSGVEFADITRADVRNAAELLVVGTTMNVVAVSEYDGRPTPLGVRGPVYQALSRLLLDDIANNAATRTRVF